MQDSIIALQTAGVDCAGDGTITSQGYNIESGTSCGFTGTDDQQNVTSGALKLGLLADNGGPTKTTPSARAAWRLTRRQMQRVPTRQSMGWTSAGPRATSTATAWATRATNAISARSSSCACGWVLRRQRRQRHSPGTRCDAPEYQVWRSNSPYSGFALFQGGLTGTSLGVTIDPNLNYYYEVRAVGALGGGPLAVSNRIGVFSFGLVPGS